MKGGIPPSLTEEEMPLLRSCLPELMCTSFENEVLLLFICKFNLSTKMCIFVITTKHTIRFILLSNSCNKHNHLEVNLVYSLLTRLCLHLNISNCVSFLIHTNCCAVFWFVFQSTYEGKDK